MDTLLILKDSIIAHSVKIVDTCKDCSKEAAVNNDEVWIVSVICITIVLVALIVSVAWYRCYRAKICFLTGEKSMTYQQKFLSYCEDRKDIREDKDFIKFCINKYMILMEERFQKEKKQ